MRAGVLIAFAAAAKIGRCLFCNTFPLTTQNIVVGFHINREVPEGRGSEERKIVSTDLLFKET